MAEDLLTTVSFKEGTTTHLLLKEDEINQVRNEYSQHKNNACILAGITTLLVLALIAGICLYFVKIVGGPTLMITTSICLPSLIFLVIYGVKTWSNYIKTREKAIELAIPKATAEKIFLFFLRNVDGIDKTRNHIIKKALIFDLIPYQKNLIKKLRIYSQLNEPFFPLAAEAMEYLIFSMEINSEPYQAFQQVRTTVGLDIILRKDITLWFDVLTRFQILSAQHSAQRNWISHSAQDDFTVVDESIRVLSN